MKNKLFRVILTMCAMLPVFAAVQAQDSAADMTIVIKIMMLLRDKSGESRYSSVPLLSYERHFTE